MGPVRRGTLRLCVLASMQTSDSSDPTFRVLASSPVLHAFRQAYEQLTTLPVVLAGRDAIDWGFGRPCTAICANLKNGHPDCAGCLRIRESGVARTAQSYRCHFGLLRTAVPIHAAGSVVGHLWTGWAKVEDADRPDPSDDWEPVRQIDVAHAFPGSSTPSRGRSLSRTTYSAAVQILTAFATAAQPFSGISVGSRQPERCVAVAKATEIIAREYAQDVSLRSVACRCNVTPAYFSGLFRRSMGATFTDYVTRFRVERAKELLASDELRVSEVAYACGFGSHSQFNRMFQRVVGTSPRNFRATSLCERTR